MQPMRATGSVAEIRREAIDAGLIGSTGGEDSSDARSQAGHDQSIRVSGSSGVGSASSFGLP